MKVIPFFNSAIFSNFQTTLLCIVLHLIGLHFTLSIGLIPRAHAEESTETSITESNDATHFRHRVGLENSLYRDVVSPSVFPIIRLGTAYEKTVQHPDGQFETMIDLEFRGSLRNLDAFSFASQNAYWGESDESHDSALRFSFGRRKILWSELDEMWSLGAIQPLDSWDRLRPELQGLTGIFAFSETRHFNFRFFFSGISLPETTPNISLESSQFRSIHPQSVTATPQTIAIRGRPVPLGYTIEKPELNKILIRSSTVLMMETKAELPIQVRFTYGNLPLNYFPLALVGNYVSPLDQVVVTLRPRLLEHKIYNVDVGYQIAPKTRLGINGMVDDPGSESVPTDYTYTPLTSQTLLSPWLKKDFEHLRLTLSHLWVKGGLAADVGPYASSDQSIFSSHVFYRSASQVVAHFFPTSIDDAGSLKLKLIYDHSINAGWLSWDILIRQPGSDSSGWRATIGGDVIQAKQTVARSRGAEFLADVRALDRLRMGVSYGF